MKAHEPPNRESRRSGSRWRHGKLPDPWEMLERLSTNLEETDPRTMAGTALRCLGEYAGAAHGSLYVGDPGEGLRLAGAIGRRRLPEEVSRSDGVEAPLMLRVAERGEALFLEDVERFWRDSGLPPRAARRTEQGPACIILPLLSRRRPCGVLNLSALGSPLPAPRSARRRALLHGSRLVATSLRVAGILEELEGRASRDGLTGLYNYATFYELLGREVFRAERYRSPLSLLLFDLDYFKGLNDRYGHLAGDAVLTGIAERLAAVLRAIDLPARYGGDEFVVILPQTNAAGALKVAERIRESVEAEPFHYLRTPIPVTISVGAAQLAEGMTAVDLVGKADHSLYCAKRAGRNRVASNDP